MKTLIPEFHTHIPSQKREGVLYISMEFATASHLCPCGCGLLVVTPLSPVFWQLNFDGETISLSPSIGNHDFPCRSHYWIIKNKIFFDKQMSKKEINDVREKDSKDLNRYLVEKSSKKSKKKTWLRKLKLF